MDAAYLRAVVPEPFRVLGLKLEPFSIGHYLLLHRFDVAFVTGVEPNIGDLFLGVWICAHSWEENNALLDSSRFWEDMATWRGQVYGRGLLGWVRPRKVDLGEKTKLFLDYVEQGLRWPKFFYEDQQASATAGAPFVQTVKVVLMKEVGLSESDVLNRPMALCLWDYITLGELNGKVQIYNEAEHQAMQSGADAFDAAYRKLKETKS